MLAHLAEACRHYRRAPTVAELQLYRRNHPSFPGFKAIGRRFDGLKMVAPSVQAWAAKNEAYADVALLLAADATGLSRAAKRPDGSVYLLESGDHHKIGRSDELEKRVKSIRVALPQAASLVHEIKSDDPPGIEAYWHRRFDDKRANGEWFKLNREDVAAFKRSKFQ